MTQNEIILNLLKKKSITAIDAMNVGCFRLAARIYDLKGQGYNIVTENVSKNGKKFARYHLMSGVNEVSNCRI